MSKRKLMKKILIVEDERDLRDLIAFNLKLEGYSPIEAEDANCALMIMESTEIDMILLDMMLPGLKGDQFLRIVKTSDSYKHIPVIIISARGGEADVVNGLKSGAEDYLVKPFSTRILITKIGVIFKRVNSTSERDGEISYGGVTIDTRSREVFSRGKRITLTNKEFELLLFLLQHPHRAFTRDQLLSSVWGYESDVYTRTVDSHISSLRKKLGEVGRIIKSIPKIGYKVE